MKAVRVLGPAGADVAVYEVAVESEGQIVSFLRSVGGRAQEAVGRYASLAEALKRNRRSVTSADELDVPDLATARALVE